MDYRLSTILHLLNGDALAEKFPANDLSGKILICREALIDGPLGGENLSQFWETRAAFIQETYGAPREEYRQKVTAELENLLALPSGTELNLWFEHDLFCQTNLWFTLSLLQPQQELAVYIVYPRFKDPAQLWQGFGPLTTEELLDSYHRRYLLSADELQLGAALWKAYQVQDLDQLARLSEHSPEAFPYLREVCRAHIERFPSAGRLGRPQRVLNEIISQENPKDFVQLFHSFSRREGIYGFGDLQVKSLVDRP